MRADRSDLGERFGEALQFAHELHQGQCRNGSPRPYIGHLLGVCALVLEHGGDQDQAIAGLLHDAVEDQGGPPVLAGIERRFGSEVARIVAACTDDPDQSDWRRRKERYLQHLPDQDAPVVLVSAADKLDNVRALVRDHARHGDAIWQRWAGGRAARLWYYRAVTDALRQTGHHAPLAAELAADVARMERQVGPA